MTTPIISPFAQFNDKTGLPMDAGFIYIGQPNTNPEIVANQISVYWDAAGAFPAAQPIRTVAGYPRRDGAIGKMYINGGYAITVRNSRKELVFYAPDSGTGLLLSQWIDSGVKPTYVSATTFSLVGDQTVEFHPGRRVQLITSSGAVYGTITASVFSGVTTVTVAMDGAGLDSGLSAVNLSILRNDHLALPGFSVVAQTQNYRKLPDGTIEQWGTVPSDAIGFAPFSFPIAFPNACLDVQISTQVGAGASNFTATKVGNATTTGATAAVFVAGVQSSIAGQVNVSYRVIGY